MMFHKYAKTGTIVYNLTIICSFHKCTYVLISTLTSHIATHVPNLQRISTRANSAKHIKSNPKSARKL